jgi:hypothetical protein
VNDASLIDNTAQCTIAMRLAGMPTGTSARCTATGGSTFGGVESVREGV